MLKQLIYLLFFISVILVWRCAGDGKWSDQCQQHIDCGINRICIYGACVSHYMLEPPTQEQIKVAESKPEHTEYQQPERPDHVIEMLLPDADESLQKEIIIPDIPREEIIHEQIPREEIIHEQIIIADADGGTSEIIPEQPGIPEAECLNGQVRACYDGPPDTRNVGQCRDGEQRCLDGKWGTCIGQQLPAHTEICDGRDNTCNGVIDESCPCYYLGLPWGVCRNASRDQNGKCLKPTTYSAIEICGDGLDNNCNGIIDENCPCNMGESKPCASDTGECRLGKQTCSDQGKWGACIGGIFPRLEQCDGKDHNCNGAIDDGCPCYYLDKNTGICLNSQRDANGKCIQPAQYSNTEICGDQIDNNCNSIIDENCPCLYLAQIHGVCKTATTNDKGICQKPQNYSDTEICGDGLDNNCNGVIDEGCQCNYLGQAHGVCATAKRDQQGVCVAPNGYHPTEICGDGIDNNCNGAVDENCPCYYQNAVVGVCAMARRNNLGICLSPPGYSAQEDCNDSRDNNCSGVAYDGCPCTPNEERICGTSLGTCKIGIQRCNQHGQWETSCIGSIQPVAEICDDGKDNNCNGTIDEFCPCHYKGLNAGVCKNARRDANGQCMASHGYHHEEICGDGLDNNCNGSVDEFCPCNYKDLNVGVCKNARRDAKGECQKPEGYSETEICGDGLDNNCNGSVDEGCPCNYAGKTDGVCLNSTRDEHGICKRPQHYSDFEICGDGLDNNCNGIVDENCPCNYQGRAIGVCLDARKDSNAACQMPPGYQHEEICGDGLDNNCNGQIDEICDCFYKNSNQGVCAYAQRDRLDICQAPPEYSDKELCGDNLDNNCNGIVDEGCPCNYKDLNVGVCATATRDEHGVCQKPDTYRTDWDACDGLDNNCNGIVDEGGFPCYDISDDFCRIGKGTCTATTDKIVCIFTSESLYVECKKPDECKILCPNANYECKEVKDLSIQVCRVKK
jgi:hypothetical protein